MQGNHASLTLAPHTTMTPSKKLIYTQTLTCGRGGALTTDLQERSQTASSLVARPNWHVLWTHSNYESAVYEQLCTKGYEIFFARMDQWVASKKGKHLVRVPMFRSYLFIHHCIDKYDYIDICKTKGLVRILGDRWDKLAAIPDKEIEAIRMVCSADCPVRHYPYLQHGDKVRMTRGSLKDTEGILIRNDDLTGLLVISVAMLNRSVSVEVNCTDVVPV